MSIDSLSNSAACRRDIDLPNFLPANLAENPQTAAGLLPTQAAALS
jgi:hypothetical protein